MPLNALQARIASQKGLENLTAVGKERRKLITERWDDRVSRATETGKFSHCEVIPDAETSTVYDHFTKLGFRVQVSYCNLNLNYILIAWGPTAMEEESSRNLLNL